VTKGELLHQGQTEVTVICNLTPFHLRGEQYSSKGSDEKSAVFQSSTERVHSIYRQGSHSHSEGPWVESRISPDYFLLSNKATTINFPLSVIRHA
jgi:hypothetical protein